MASHTLRELRAAKRELARRLTDRAFRAHFKAGRWDRRGSIESESKCILNITGVGIGSKISSGGYTGESAIVVQVLRKQPKKNLSRAQRVPTRIAGIPTDIVQVGRIRATQLPSSFHQCILDPKVRLPRPLPSGVSIGTSLGGSGTVATVVKSRDGGERLLLSNYHVLADLSDPSASPHTYQPGRSDARPTQENRLGQLQRGRKLRFDNRPNLVDCAVSGLADERAVDPFVCGIGPIRGKIAPREHRVVMGFGRTSRFYKGVIQRVDEDIVVLYGRRRARFTGQIAVQALPPGRGAATQGGDSGSLLVDVDSRKAVGLVFARTRNFTYATPIRHVLNALQVDLITQP